MEFYKYVQLWIFCTVVYVSCTSRKCGNCVCKRLLQGIKYMCPNENIPEIIIKVEDNHNVVKIQCTEELRWYNYNLPLLAIENVDYLTFQQCSTSTNFSDMLSKLKVSNTKMLEFNFHSNLRNITLTDNYFKGVHDVEKLILTSGNIVNIDENAFQSLDKLTELNLDYNEIQLKDFIFNDLLKLKTLALTGNKISDIPETLFKYTEKLQSLTMSDNKITYLPNEVFSSLTLLKTLNLESNLLSIVRKRPFEKLKSLEKLNLKNNRIKTIERDSFEMVYNLNEIILANNYFDLPQTSMFFNNHKLKIVDLRNNRISVMGDFSYNFNLLELDLSYNLINNIRFSEIFVGNSALHINLTYNHIARVDFETTEEIPEQQENFILPIQSRRLSINGNPIECNCYAYDLVRYLNHNIHPVIPKLITIEAGNLTCSSPKDFVNISVTELKPNMLTCSLQEIGIEDTFTDKCLYGFRPWDTSLIVNCTNLNLTKVPELILPTQNIFTQTEVCLKNNFLTSSPGPNMGYENVTKLFLSSNNIDKVSWLPPKLQVLELHENNISYLNEEILNELKPYLTSITLRKNPWNCDCSLVNLAKFIILNWTNKQLQIDDDVNSIKCKHSGKPFIRLNFCADNNRYLVQGVSTTFSILVLTIVILVVVYYRFQQEIKVWLYAHNIFLWFVTEDEIDKNKLYDVFISYSHNDEKFVLNELVAVLEEGPQPYKLCLAIRNWIAGEFISKQIVTSVKESRRTLVILSQDYLNSEWGLMEFRTAHKQAIQERRTRVILILYGDIDIHSDLDDELKVYIRTNTYVKWDDPWFWDKLRDALPHSRV